MFIKNEKGEGNQSLDGMIYMHVFFHFIALNLIGVCFNGFICKA